VKPGLLAALQRSGWLIGLLAGAAGFALIFYAGFVWDSAGVDCAAASGTALPDVCRRPEQLVKVGATLLFLGGGVFGLWLVDWVGRRTRASGN
jgi:hypothetical protein